MNAEEGLREILRNLGELIVSLGARVTAVETDRPSWRGARERRA